MEGGPRLLVGGAKGVGVEGEGGEIVLYNEYGVCIRSGILRIRSNILQVPALI